MARAAPVDVGMMLRAAARARRVALGSPAFVAILSMSMAVTALGIDTVLPAYSELRTAFGLEPDAAAITGVITFFFMGSSLGLLPAGLVSDRFGRKRVFVTMMLVMSVVAAAASVITDFWIFIAARFFHALLFMGKKTFL